MIIGNLLDRAGASGNKAAGGLAYGLLSNRPSCSEYLSVVRAVKSFDAPVAEGGVRRQKAESKREKWPRMNANERK
jgi:hypothetical protein